MNFTSLVSLANENSSEETNGTTAILPTSRSFAYIDWLNYASSYIRWVVFVVGTLGNILVLAVLLWRRSNSQVGTQLFVGSLAVADLGLMFGAVWVTAYDILTPSWQFGLIPCKLLFLWQSLTMNCQGQEKIECTPKWYEKDVT